MSSGIQELPRYAVAVPETGALECTSVEVSVTVSAVALSRGPPRTTTRHSRQPRTGKTH